VDPEKTITVAIPASEIKLGDIYVTQAAFAPIRYREVIGIRPCVGEDEHEHVELTLKKDKRAPHGSEASVPVDRVVKVRRMEPQPEKPTFAGMTEDERRYVCENRSEFPHLDAEVIKFFADFWAESRRKEDERAELYPSIGIYYDGDE
jgi:hypothetical protein